MRLGRLHTVCRVTLRGSVVLWTVGVWVGGVGCTPRAVGEGPGAQRVQKGSVHAFDGFADILWDVLRSIGSQRFEVGVMGDGGREDGVGPGCSGGGIQIESWSLSQQVTQWAIFGNKLVLTS